MAPRESAFPMIARCSLAQWRGLTDKERDGIDAAWTAGLRPPPEFGGRTNDRTAVALSMKAYAWWLWQVEYEPYRLAPHQAILMTVKTETFT